MNTNNELSEKVKELIKKGNVTKIIVKDKNGKKIVSFNTNVGIIGGLVAMSAAPWALIATAIVTAGTGCTVKVIKDNGEVITLSDTIENVTNKVGDTAENIRDTIMKHFNK